MSSDFQTHSLQAVDCADPTPVIFRKGKPPQTFRDVTFQPIGQTGIALVIFLNRLTQLGLSLGSIWCIGNSSNICCTSRFILRRGTYWWAFCCITYPERSRWGERAALPGDTVVACFVVLITKQNYLSKMTGEREILL